MSDCVLLILSCDKYADLWEATLTLHDRYWPNCPYVRYLASDTLKVSHPNVHSVTVGDTLPWSDAFACVVDQIHSEFVLLMLEDFFFTASVDTKAVVRLFEDMRRLDAAYLRLNPWPRPDRRIQDLPEIGEIAIGAPYRTSLQAAFWRVDELRRLLIAGENPWRFEVDGARRSDSSSRRFLSAWRHTLPYIEVVERGYWQPRGVALCRRERLPIDFERRRALDWYGRLNRARVQVQSHIVNAVPWQLRRKIRMQLMGARGRRDLE